MKNKTLRLIFLLTIVCVVNNAFSQTAATKLYWVQSSGTAANDQFVRSDLDGTNVTILASGASNFNNPFRLSIDQARGYAYITDQPAGTGPIYRFDLTGGGRTTIAATSATFTYNDVQVAGDYIYWVQSSGTAANDQLVRANLDGSGVTILASGAGNFANPVNLWVDLEHQYIYVADQTSANVGVVRYDLTGGNRTVVLPASGSSFQYNDLQVAGGYLYWVQSSATSANDALMRSDLNGGSVTTLASDAANFSNPVTIAVDASLGYIYVGDQTSTNAGILRYNLAGGSRTTIEASSGSSFQYNGLALNTDYNSPYTTSVSVPANGTYKIGDNLNFTVNWNTAVTVTGSPYIPLTIGASSKNATYLSGSGTSALVFRYTVASGDFDNNGIAVGSSITLNGGTISASSLNANLTLNSVGSTASVNVDGIAPTVSSINRQTPATQTTTASTLIWRVTFSESVSNVDISDFQLTQVSGSPTGTIASVSASSGTTIDVTVNSVSGNGTIRLDLKSSGTGIVDAAGNAISGGYTSGQTYIIPTPGLWTGATSTNFNLASNWDDNNVPTAGVSVTIPTGVTNMPVLNATGSINNLTLQTGTTLTLNGNQLVVGGNISVAGTGKIIGSSTSQLSIGGTGASTLTMDQTTDGTTNALRFLSIIGSGTTTLTGKLNIYSLLTLSAGTLALNGNTIVMKSTSISSTAMIAAVSGTITYGSGGKFTVERYIPLGKRAYRLLAPGVSGSSNSTAISTIYQNWQNGGTLTSGIGTHITGNGTNGTDATATGQNSMFTYTPGALNFTAVTSTNNTNDTLSAIRGYRIFIRGDRTASNLTQNNNTGTGTSNINMNTAITLSATGRILAGTIVFNSTTTTVSGVDGWQWQKSNAPVSTGTGANDSYSLIPNPYVAMVDWNGVTLNNLSTTYYVWDPNKNLRGGYESYNRVGGVASSANVSRYIQPGQAFFIQTTGASPSLTITESNKNTNTVNLLNAFKTNTVYPRIDVTLVYNSRPNVIADNCIAVYDNTFSAGIDAEDSYKMENPDDNVILVRNNVDLGVEGRPMVNSNDTLALKLSGLQTDTSYLIKVSAENFTLPAGYAAFLEDLYTNTSIGLVMGGTITRQFIKLSDSASFFKRFRIVFRPMGTLPIEITRVNAYEKGNGNQVEWTNASESNVKEYIVERSANGALFTNVAMVDVRSNNNAAVDYKWYDAVPGNEVSYYRIRIMGINGSVKLSPIVKVNRKKSAAGIQVFPNPVRGQDVTLQLNGIEKGTYTMRIVDMAGRTIIQQKIEHSGGNSSHALQLSGYLSGIYRVQLISNRIKLEQKLVIE